MEGKRFLHKVALRNILSYGPEGLDLELEPLNLLVGPNGSGKSNLIEGLSLLKAAADDISAPIRTGGGFEQWLWKRPKGSEGGAVGGFEVSVVVAQPSTDPEQPRLLEYSLSIEAENQVPIIGQERIVSRWPNVATIYSSSDRGEMAEPSGAKLPRLDPGQSVLSQVKGSVWYSEITYLGQCFRRICLLRNAALGHTSALRHPQRADETAAVVKEDGSNFGVLLNDQLSRAKIKKELLQRFRAFYPAATDLVTRVYANAVEVVLHEGDIEIPAVRWSDGMLRYLFLLVALHHPEPPPLVCIEDPEIGLHPDAIPLLADVLKDASQRMQLIVTTHADVLVSALSDWPEAVITCERYPTGTRLSRLDPAQLASWLGKYSLGELWMMGELGGTT